MLIYISTISMNQYIFQQLITIKQNIKSQQILILKNSIAHMYSSHITPKRRHSSLFSRMQNEIKKISKKLSAAKQSYRQSSLPKNYNTPPGVHGHGNNTTATFFNQEATAPKNNQNQDYMRSINSIDEQTVIATTRNNPERQRHLNRNGRSRNYRAASAVTNENAFEANHNYTAPLRDLWENRLDNNNTSTDNVVIKGLSTLPLKKKLYKNNMNFNMKGQSFELPTSLTEQPQTMKILFKLQEENSSLSFKLGRMSSVCEQKSYNAGRLRAQLRETSRELQNAYEKHDKENCYLVTLLEHYKGKAEKYKKVLKKSSQVSIDLESDSQ